MPDSTNSTYRECELQNHLERHRHLDEKLKDKDSRLTTIVIVGNPNVGKSLVFNFLSGLYVDVSNYPGTTVEMSRGIYNSFEIYDTPGVYGISSFTDEEIATRDLVIKADIVLNVVDSVHLERDFFLTQQLIDMGKKVAVLLNFQDELRKNGMEIDIRLLSEKLGVPVYPVTATKKAGFEQLDAAIHQARRGVQNPKLHCELHSLLSRTGSEAEALLILEGDEVIAQRHGIDAGTEREMLYIERRNKVNELVNAILIDRHTAKRASQFFGRLSLSIWTGVPLLIGILYSIYLFIGKLVAQDLVSFTEKSIGRGLWEPWIRNIITAFISPESWLGVILVGEFGIVTMTVTYLIFLLLPLVIAFYLALALLEDSGYLPRLATLVDRSLNYIGLNGIAVIPLVLGFGCITMATITTRLLGSKREKQIVTTILQFAVPCSAQLAVIAAMLAGAGFKAMLIYSVTIFAVFVTLGSILHRWLPGETTALLIDLPPLRMPRMDNVFKKTVYRSYYFMKEATPWFFAGAFVVGIMQVTGLLEVWQNLLHPLTVHWLQLPGEAAAAFVMGLVRRDFGAAGLYSLNLSTSQIVTALVTITLFVPCIASLMVMIKERGLKEAITVWLGTWVTAFFIGGIVSHILL